MAGHGLSGQRACCRPLLAGWELTERPSWACLPCKGINGARTVLTFGAPGQITAQIGSGVLAVATLETGQVGSHRPAVADQ